VSTDFFGGGFFGGGFFSSQTPAVTRGGAGGLITFLAWRPDQILLEQSRLRTEFKKKKRKLKTVERKIERAEKQEHPQGILANLHLLQEQRRELRNDIEIAAVNLEAIKQYFGDDEDDLEVILFDS
jgi:hypothetical protein